MSSSDPQKDEVDIAAWRLEVKTFAEQIQQSLNSVGDMLLAEKTEANAIAEATEIGKQIDDITRVPESKETATGGRMDQLRAKLAQKFSEKNN